MLEAHFDGQLPDPDDQPFADVAFTGDADVLITGNGDNDLGRRAAATLGIPTRTATAPR